MANASALTPPLRAKRRRVGCSAARVTWFELRSSASRARGYGVRERRDAEFTGPDGYAKNTFVPMGLFGTGLVDMLAGAMMRSGSRVARRTSERAKAPPRRRSNRVDGRRAAQ